VSVRASVRPAAVVAAGVLVAAFEFRLRGVDLLLDPVGWLLVAWGARKLQATKAAASACVAALASVTWAALPYRFVYLHPLTGEVVRNPEGHDLDYPTHLRWDRVSGARAAVMAAALVFGGLALWWLLGELAWRARRSRADGSARTLQALRVAVAAAWVAPFVLVVAVQVARDGTFDPVWNDGLELVALPGLAAVVALAVVLVRGRDAAWAVLAGWGRPSRWGGRGGPDGWIFSRPR
jgi:hypothetical protein